MPVVFEIAEITKHDAIDNDFSLMATYGPDAGQARFIVWLKMPEGMDEDAAVPVVFSEGSFRRVPGLKPTQFLQALNLGLCVDSPRLSHRHQDRLPFEFVYLGPPAERDPEGGFSDEPGDWILTKLFLAGGKAQVFFNFNLVTGEAEFAVKDPYYGDIVVSELSKILW